MTAPTRIERTDAIADALTYAINSLEHADEIDAEQVAELAALALGKGSPPVPVLAEIADGILAKLWGAGAELTGNPRQVKT